MQELSLLSGVLGGVGSVAQIAIAAYMWRLDRRVYRLELKLDVES